MSSAFNIPEGYKLVSGEAYGQRYHSLVAPDGKIIENAYEQGAPEMFAFLSALAAPTPTQVAEAPKAVPQAVVGEASDEQLDAIADAHRWDTREGRREMLRAALTPSPAPSAAPHQGGPTMEDALTAGDGTLHGAIDYWQGRALAAEAARDVDETNKVLADNYLRATAPHQGADALREDAERLDWIERHVCDVSRLGDSARTLRISWSNGADYAFVGPRYNANWREAIDAARAALAQHQPQQGEQHE